MKKLAGIYLLPSAALISGCTTHLNVVDISPGNPQHREGAPYYLPWTQFDATVTWTPSCDDEGVFSIRANTTAKPKALRDPSAMYLIDYTSMDSMLKTSSISAEFYEDTGFLKTINASADDQLAETLASTAAVVGNLASLGVGGDPGSYYCSPSLVQGLTDVRTESTNLAAATRSLENANNALKRKQAAVLRAGGQMDQRTLAELNQLVSNVESAIALKDVAATALARVRQAVIHSQTVKFPDDSASTARAAPLELPQSKLAGWFVTRDENGQNVTPNATAAGLLANKLKVRLELTSDWLVSSQSQARVNAPGPEAGIRYRVPVAAVLRTCLGTGLTCDAPAKVSELPVQIMQAGTTFYLPFESRSFTNASLTASFSKTGTLTSFGYVQSESAAANIASTASSLTQAAAGISPARRARELARLQGEAGILEAEANLEALRAAAAAQNSSETASAVAEEAEAEAELIELEANITIRAVQSLVEGETP